MRLTSAVVASVLVSSVAAAQVAPSIDLAISIRPVRSGGPEVTAVELTTEIRGTLPAARTFSVQSPIVYAGRTGIADRVDGLVVRDASGAVPLTVQDDPVNRGGFPYYRHWRA